MQVAPSKTNVEAHINASIDTLVQALAGCHRAGTELNAEDWADVVRTEADAYAVQDGVAAALGWPLALWKSGGAGPQGPFSHSPVNPIVGQLSQLSQPQREATGRLKLLGVEAEVALRLARDVTPDQALGTLGHDLIDGMCIAIECVASRWQQGLDAPALLRMADFQSNAGLLLGPWQPYRPLDWASTPWRFALPGQPEIVRQGGHSLADPAGVLPAWLRHLTRHGETARAGTVVTTGAWGGLHPLPDARAGDELKLSFEGLGEWSVRLPAAAHPTSSTAGSPAG